MGHWKKVFKSNFLASSDIDDKDLVLVIKDVKQELCTLSTGKELCNVAHFTDTSFKPMILNVGNSKIVKRFAGNNPETDTWKNIPVTIYVNSNVRLGNDTVEGLRIRPVQPKIDKKGAVKKQELTPDSQNWGAIVKWIQDGNPIEKVWEKYEVSDENKTKLAEAIEEVRDEKA